MFEGIVKGLYFSVGVSGGQYVGVDTSSSAGMNGIGVGDGYHDYLVAGFVSCNHTGIVPKGRTVVSAQLVLQTSRVFGNNPFSGPKPAATITLDMVRTHFPTSPNAAANRPLSLTTRTRKHTHGNTHTLSSRQAITLTVFPRRHVAHASMLRCTCVVPGGDVREEPVAGGERLASHA